MPKRDDGNEGRQYRVPNFGDASNQTDVADVVIASPGTLGEFDFLTAYNLCPQGVNPQNVTGIILRALQLHFSNADFINRADLKTYIWDTDPSVSKIKISPSTRFRGTEANQLPAIIVKRGSIQSIRQVIGDHARIDTEKEDQGDSTFYRAMQGTHYIACAAEADAQAELLAMEVFDTMSWISPILRTSLPFMDFQVTNLSELTLLDALGNKLGAQISVQYTFEYGWHTIETAPVVAAIGLTTQPTVNL